MHTVTQTKPTMTREEALIKVSAALAGFGSSSDHSAEALSTHIKSLAKKKGKEVLDPLKCIAWTMTDLSPPSSSFPSGRTKRSLTSPRATPWLFQNPLLGCSKLRRNRKVPVSVIFLSWLPSLILPLIRLCWTIWTMIWRTTDVC